MSTGPNVLVARQPRQTVASRSGRIVALNDDKNTSLVDELDLSVDFDSDVEDSLGTDLWEDLKDDTQESSLLKQYAVELGYSDNMREFWDYYNQMKTVCPPYSVEAMLSYLRSKGVELWIKQYVIDSSKPLDIAFYALGVLLTRQQRKLDEKARLSLLKAAAFRVMRRRAPKTFACPAMLAAVADRIRFARRIIVLSGAGISVSCGIPDFRSRDGLYAQLFSSGAYDLDDPQQMFDINYFQRNPYDIPFEFYAIAQPPLHQGIRKARKGISVSFRCASLADALLKLLRNYTQNIDGLEAKACISRVYQCHGSFATARCINCRVTVPGDLIRDDLLAQRVPLCTSCNSEEDLKPKKVRRRKKKKKRNDGWESDDAEELSPLPPGIMKPGITFFGEKLSRNFDRKVFRDIKVADLLIVIGTSVKVRPVSEIISHLPHQVETIVINKTPLPHFYPDYQLLGDADTVVKHLIRYLGWKIDAGRPYMDILYRDPQRKHSNSTYKVIGKSGVMLFKGAEGGRYVADLIAERKARGLGPNSPDGVWDGYLTESDTSESEDGGREVMTREDEGQAARKRPRRSLNQKPSDFRTGW
ncbi:SIR2 [Sanghuangporus sanghuang]